MDKKQAENYIKEYIKRLKRDVRPKSVILYGSFLKGNYQEGSDIDLIIVSDYFSRLDEDDRLEILYRKTVGLPLDFHLHGLTPGEYKNASPLTSLYQVKKTGVSQPI